MGMISRFHSCATRILGKFQVCKNTLKQFLLFAQETLEDETEIKRPGDVILEHKTSTNFVTDFFVAPFAQTLHQKQVGK